MTYQQPAFMVDHPCATLCGFDNFIDSSTDLTDDEIRALFDYRANEMAVFDSAGFQSPRYDMLTNQTGFNRCVIPAGHGLDGATSVDVYHDAGSAFPHATLVGTSGAVTGTAVIEIVVTVNPGERYWAVNINGSAAWSLGELWLGEKVSLSSGAWVDPSYTDEFETPSNDRDFYTRRVVLKLGTQRRRFSLRVRNVTHGSDDWDILEEVAQSGGTPFMYWHVESADEGPFMVQLERDVQRSQDFAAPSVNTRYSYDIRMIEVTA